MVQESLKAAEELEKDGYSVEVIDLRTVQPIDIDTLVASVENWTCCSCTRSTTSSWCGCTSGSRISRASNSFIRSSIARVAASDTIYPFTQAENVWLPNKKIL